MTQDCLHLGLMSMLASLFGMSRDGYERSTGTALSIRTRIEAQRIPDKMRLCHHRLPAPCHIPMSHPHDPCPGFLAAPPGPFRRDSSSSSSINWRESRSARTPIICRLCLWARVLRLVESGPLSVMDIGGMRGREEEGLDAGPRVECIVALPSLLPVPTYTNYPFHANVHLTRPFMLFTSHLATCISSIRHIYGLSRCSGIAFQPLTASTTRPLILVLVEAVFRNHRLIT